MADLTATKAQFAADMVDLARETLILVQKLDYLNASLGAHGFQQGGPNQFVDTDFSVNNQQLTASKFYDTMFAIGTLDNASINIRSALLGCLPGAEP